MRYKLRDIPSLVRTPLGRMQIVHGLFLRIEPFFTVAAHLYRRFFIHKTRIITVVGSFGKTSATRCIASGLALPKPGYSGGNSGISLAKNILHIKPFDTCGVVEVGISQKGQMSGSARMVRPDVTVVMSIGSEHNRSLGDLATTRWEKAAMVRALKPTGLAVLNGDDPNVLWMTDQTTAKVVTFGMGAGNHVRATDIRLDWPRGTCFKLQTGSQNLDVMSPFFGKHMVYPVLAAAAVASRQGIDPASCVSRVARLKPKEGRLQPVHLDNGVIVLRDDFKSAQETIYAALDLLEEIPARRKIVVFGEVNEPFGIQGSVYGDIGVRIGQVATQAFFLCSKTSFQSYCKGAVSAGTSRDKLVNAGKNGLLNLIEQLRSELRPKDVLLVKGRINQHMERIAFALQGRKVACGLGMCDAKSTSCSQCPMLESGWAGRKIIF